MEEKLIYEVLIFFFLTVVLENDHQCSFTMPVTITYGHISHGDDLDLIQEVTIVVYGDG